LAGNAERELQMTRLSARWGVALVLTLVAGVCSCGDDAIPEYSIECTLEVRFDSSTTINESGIIEPSLGASGTVSVPPYQMTMSIGRSNLGGMAVEVEFFEETAEGTLHPLDLSIESGLPPETDPGRLLLGSGGVWAHGHRITPSCVAAG
jgi:hypothetical protein